MIPTLGLWKRLCLTTSESKAIAVAQRKAYGNKITNIQALKQRLI